MKWTDVAVHACKILNQTKKVVFVSSDELERSHDMVDQARNDGYRLVTLPRNIRGKLRGLRDDTGAPVRGLDVFTKEWMDSFAFEFVEESSLTADERAVFMRRDEIADLAGGWPKAVREVLVSTTMRPSDDGRNDAEGLWEEDKRRIIIKRDQLNSLRTFAGTLLHEITHARTGEEDVTREFELALTDLIGQVATKALSAAPTAPAPKPASPRAQPSSPRRAAPSPPPQRSTKRPARAKAPSRKPNKPTRKKGTAMVRAFVRRLLDDPAVTRVQTDPAPTNLRAIRCYEKAGFLAVGEIDTPDGRALLMICERA